MVALIRMRWSRNRCLPSLYCSHSAGQNYFLADKGGKGRNVKIHEAEVMFGLLHPFRSVGVGGGTVLPGPEVSSEMPLHRADAVGK